MPIIIPKDIPAYKVLKQENVFVMTERRAVRQDIRPIEIAILNLMPTKIETETQLIRLLSNSPLQVNLTLLNTATYESKNISKAHLDKFYKNFDSIKNKNIDGMIITGAPVETMEFEDVMYWNELTEILEYAKKHVTSTLFICWGSQAALKYYYGIGKHTLPEKLFGVYEHKTCQPYDPLVKGMDDVFYIPHSRHTASNEDQIYSCEDLIVIAKSEEAGPAILKSKNNKHFFFSGHSEYDKGTLLYEYERDLNKGMKIAPPCNYFTDEKSRKIEVKWRSAANILFSNWLNYYVYQVTPYNLQEMD
jgi:homoserine O-succinyltransferase